MRFSVSFPSPDILGVEHDRHATSDDFIEGRRCHPEWHLVNAEGKILGRLATQIALILMGKHRPQYTPHVDTGDFVVVTNASGLVLTGRKAEKKMRHTYSGYPGGLKAESYGSLMDRRPELVMEEAVRRMPPKGPLGRTMLKKLKVYAGQEHPHHAQQPEPLEIA